MEKKTELQIIFLKRKSQPNFENLFFNKRLESEKENISWSETHPIDRETWSRQMRAGET